MKGYVQVYTGDGKGKTTAALGLALRAVGAGLKVYLAQFIKRGTYSEINALKRFSDSVTVEQFGCGRFAKGKPSAEDISAARKGLARIKEIISSGQYPVVILDEANVAVSCGLLAVQDLLDIIDLKPEDMELVITGRDAAPQIVEKADLVSEVNAIKHYFQNGVTARIGIEK
ncbi:MAG: cob(I)yrinic acid a,c-diamide adenosyltransferase [Desulfobacterales bacterium]|nr:MAG: cob(I)yrinic acid a,c-diamide adenosyltransferase [Desulfobacterales bacterium]